MWNTFKTHFREAHEALRCTRDLTSVIDPNVSQTFTNHTSHHKFIVCFPLDNSVMHIALHSSQKNRHSFLR